MPGLCRGLHARRYQHHALRGHLLKTGATWGRDGSLIMDFSQECFYLATLEDASWLNNIKSACSGNQDVFTTVDAPKRRRPMHLRLRAKTETAYAPEVTHQRAN